MSVAQPSIEEVASRVKEALESADVDRFSNLLDPAVRWGAPDAPRGGCHNRDQVLAWYRMGQAAGVRARVTEIVVGSDRILVGLSVVGHKDGGDEGERDRWQVLTVRAGRVVDIRGFDDRQEAAVRMEAGA
jgi:hypothetical protein